MLQLPRSTTSTEGAAIFRITDVIWLGDSADACVVGPEITAILNCASDLHIPRGQFLEGVEYLQIGLIDGPGTNPAIYHAAALVLCSLVREGKRVLVHDHDGGSRAATVIIMALHTLYRRGWDHWLQIIMEKTGRTEFPITPEHKRAFNMINWRLLSSVVG